MPQLTPEQAIAEAKAGQLRPVYLVVGEERYYRQHVAEALRAAALGAAGASLNEDQFVAREAEVRTIIAAARTLPMFGPRRFVVVRGLERWDAKAEAESGGVEGTYGKDNKGGPKPLDALAEYALAPSPSTTLLLLADKLDNRRRLMTVAKKEGFVVVCERPQRHALPGWIRARARDEGHAIAPRAADTLAELVGADLCALADALERVELFVGKGNELSEAAILECVANMQPGNVWDLVNAVGRRDAAAALVALSKVFEPGAGPRLVGLLAWSTRQLIRFSSARRAGLSVEQAAERASVPSFKIREISEQAKQLPLERAEAWLETLARIDLDLKGGSRLPAERVLETAVLGFCQQRNRPAPRALGA